MAIGHSLLEFQLRDQRFTTSNRTHLVSRIKEPTHGCLAPSSRRNWNAIRRQSGVTLAKSLLEKVPLSRGEIWMRMTSATDGF